jgi:hypothetical protein
MKKVKLLCLLALVVAMASASTTKNVKTLFRISDGMGGYEWTETPGDLDCIPVTELPCSYDGVSDEENPAPNTEPTTGTASEDPGQYQ